MSASAAMTAEAAGRGADAAPLIACTVCRDIDAFPQLIDQMEAALGSGWGDLTLDEALGYLDQPEAEGLEFLALAVGREDEGRLDLIGRIVKRAEALDLAVILVAAEVGPAALHALIKLGAQGFVPYPLPDGELGAAISRLPPPGGAPAPDAPEVHHGGPSPTGGAVTAVHALAGGAGGTTLAVNLAWELAGLPSRPRVCLIDLDLQFGAVATYLDLPRREAATELLADVAAAEPEAFRQALTPCRDRLQVLCAPPDMLPLDILSPGCANKLVEMARERFDHVVIDMPRSVVEWTGTVLEVARAYLAVLALDLRSAENALRLMRAVAVEGLPEDRIRWTLGRAPGRFDVAGRERRRRLAEGLGVPLSPALPDGGRAVAEACEAGAALGEASPRNPLKRAIAALAAEIHEAERAETARAAAGR